MAIKRTPNPNLPLIGWREWVGLPQLGINGIKVKVDTGARTSSLHAYHVERFRTSGSDFVRFHVHPLQKNTAIVVQSVARLLDYREVKSSNGAVTQRAVIMTDVALLDQEWSIELNLSSRDEMGFRMLLGRQAIRGRFLVDSAMSYCDSSRRPPRVRRATLKKRRDDLPSG